MARSDGSHAVIKRTPDLVFLRRGGSEPTGGARAP